VLKVSIVCPRAALGQGRAGTDPAGTLVDVLGPRFVVVTMAWIALLLAADTVASPVQQLVLGSATWVFLVLALRAVTPLVRVQTLVVVGFATVVEYVFSGWLGVYVYRLDQVPAYVPPGHGLVYLAALSIGGLVWVRRYEHVLVPLTAAVVVAYAAYGLSPLAPRPDVVGAFWAGCLVVFLAVGRARTLYVGAFVVVTYLELLGTHWGVWTWSPQDPTGLFTLGNPPSGAAGGYGWFDLAAVLAAPALLARWRSGVAARAQHAEHRLVKQPVGAQRVAAIEGS
jgi:hypothetical protein